MAPPDPAGRAPTGRTLADATAHLSADPPPPDESTGSVLAPEPHLLSQYTRYDVPPDWYISHENRIDPATGEGKIVTVLSHAQREELRHEDILKVGPGMKPYQWNVNLDLRRTNISEARFVTHVTRCTFAEANLDGALFGSVTGFKDVLIVDSVFDGASLRNTQFRYVDLDRVSFVGVDGAGARFELASTPTRVDITDSNLHPSQFVFVSDPEADSASCLTYRRYSIGDAAAELGVDVDEFAVDLWAGNVEVRDNATCEVVTGGYDDTRHHIPQWAVQAFYDPDGTAPA